MQVTKILDRGSGRVAGEEKPRFTGQALRNNNGGYNSVKSIGLHITHRGQSTRDLRNTVASKQTHAYRNSGREKVATSLRVRATPQDKDSFTEEENMWQAGREGALPEHRHEHARAPEPHSRRDPPFTR